MRPLPAVACGLALLTAALFGGAIGHGFLIRDDPRNITENPHLAGPGADGAAAFWREPYAGLYIPVTYTAWAALAAVSDRTEQPEVSERPVVDPALFHAANVGVHAVAAALAFLLLHALLGRKSPLAAALGAALFALHPLQTEAVAWATGLKDVLSGCLALGAALAFRRFAESRARGAPGRAAWAGALVLFCAALLAKPQAAVLPAILFVLATFDGTIRRRTAAAALLPHAAAAIAVVLVTRGLQADEDAVFGSVSVPLALRPLVALDAIAFYLRKLVVPLGLANDYGRTPDIVIAHALTRPWWILPIAVTAAAARARPRAPYAAALGTAALALLPVLGLVPFAHQAQSTVADRYAYLALFGFGWLLAEWMARSRSRAPAVAVAAGLLVFAGLTHRQLGYWRTNERLFERTLRVNPQSFSAAYDLGLSLSYAGRTQEAIERYAGAAALRADVPLVHQNLGVAYLRVGRFEDAVTSLRRALALRPGAPDVLLSLSIALGRLGRDDERVEVLEELAERLPGAARPHSDLGAIWLRRGRAEEAAAEFRAAAERDPDEPLHRRMLALAYHEGGRAAEAEAAARAAIALAEAKADFPADRLRLLRREHAELQRVLAAETAGE